MKIGAFFKDIEDEGVKILTFVAKQMIFVEEILGAGTGNAKANFVITAVESVLSQMGVPVGTVQAEMKGVVDALEVLMTKLGVLPPHSASTPPSI